MYTIRECLDQIKFVWYEDCNLIFNWVCQLEYELHGRELYLPQVPEAERLLLKLAVAFIMRRNFVLAFKVGELLQLHRAICTFEEKVGFRLRRETVKKVGPYAFKGEVPYHPMVFFWNGRSVFEVQPEKSFQAIWSTMPDRNNGWDFYSEDTFSDGGSYYGRDRWNYLGESIKPRLDLFWAEGYWK